MRPRPSSPAPPWRRRFLAVAVVLLGTVAALAHLAAAAPGYAVVPGWGQVPNGAEWGEVPGVSIDGQGVIFAFRRAQPPILQFEPSGRLVKAWGDGLFVMPHGLRIDRDGALWLTDARAADGKGQQVFKFSPDGQLLLTLGTRGVSGADDKTFNGPCDVAVAANGDIFVADGHTNARVVKFSQDGKYSTAWGHKGTAAGEFDVPHAIVIDSKGRVLVGDRNNKRIQIFDQNGAFIEQWGQFGRPSGMFISPDDTLYVGDISDRKGIVVGSAGDGSVRGVIEGTLPEGVAVAADGSIYAGETTTGRILRKLVPSAR